MTRNLGVSGSSPVRVCIFYCDVLLSLVENAGVNGYDVEFVYSRASCGDGDGPISATCIGYYYGPPEFMNSHPVLYVLCDVFGIVNSVVYK